VRLLLALAASAASAASAACSDRVAVLSVPVITTCELARVAAEGDACDLPEPCFQTAASGGGCCTTRETCRDGGLTVDTGCGSACTTQCGPDRDCPYGKAFCQGGLCTPCAGAHDCPACPAGWVRLERNGCPSCDCAPPSQCDVLDPSTCPDPARCYIGGLCAEGCQSFDCCVNVCSVASCFFLAPEGCPLPCRTIPGCTSCALEQCECIGNSFACRERCVAPGTVRDCKLPLSMVVIVP
jgi:hypothetical protein